MEAANDSFKDKRDDPMEAIDEIFSEFTDLEPGIHQLLEFLKKRLSEGQFYFITNQEKTVSLEDTPNIPKGKQRKLVQLAKAELKTGSTRQSRESIGFFKINR